MISAIPDFSIIVNGDDRSAVFRDRLLSLVLSDNDGETADRVEIELDDRDSRLVIPDENATVEVSLGFKGAALTPMGVFYVDGVGGTGPAQRLRITATAADMKSSIRSPKTRAWENKSLADIVETIAAEVGLKPMVGESVAATVWSFLAQTGESDLHFLSRITKPLDATAKPAGGTLLVQKRGEGKSAAGDDMPSVAILKRQLSQWSWSRDERKGYGKVSAKWSNTGGGDVETVTRGAEEPSKTLRTVFGSKDEATRACDAALNAAARDKMRLRAELASFAPDLFAGRSISISDLRPELAGEWFLASVTHRLDGSGLNTSFEAKGGAS